MLSVIFRESLKKMTELLLEIYGEEIPPSFQYEGKEKIKEDLLLFE